MNKLETHHTLCALTSPFARVEVEQLTQNDWDELIALANRHYMVPALYCALLQRGLLELLPDQAREYAAAVHALNVKRNQDLLAQLVRVTRLLNDAGIEPVLIKGAAALVEQWMPDPGSRFMFDLDLLVMKGEGERAFALLCEAGYEISGDKGSAGISVGHHYPALQREGEPALLELHIRPLSQKCAAVVDNQMIMQGAEQIIFGPMQGVKAWLPSPTEQVLLSILHSEVSHENHAIGQFDIRHAWDLPWFTRHHGEEVAWGEIKARAMEAGYGRELMGYFLLLEGYFALANPYREDVVSRGAEKHYQRVSRKIAQGSSCYDLIYLSFLHLRFAFSNRAMRIRYGDGGAWRLSYYRLYHLFWLLKKYSRLRQFTRLFYYFRLRIRDNAGR